MCPGGAEGRTCSLFGPGGPLSPAPSRAPRPAPPPASWDCACTAAALAAGLSRAPALALPFCHGVVVFSVDNGVVEAVLDGVAVPLRVVDGVAMVWFAPGGGPPAFALPTLSRPGWSAPVFDALSGPGHPAQVLRAVARPGGSAAVAGFTGIEVERAFSSSAHRCSQALRVGRALVPGGSGPALPVRAERTCHGLGYQLTEVRLPGGLRTRHRVLPTPTAPGHCRVTLAVEARWPGALGTVGQRLLRRRARASFLRRVRADVHAWGPEAGPGPEAGDPTWARYWDWVGSLSAPGPAGAPAAGLSGAPPARPSGAC